MENTYAFLKANKRKVISVINSLDSDFSSHDFLKKFSQKFEKDYVKLLSKYNDRNGAFQTVHKMTGFFLSKNKEQFNIDKTIHKKSENVHGNKTYVQYWKKLK